MDFAWERLDGRPLVYASLGTLPRRTYRLLTVAVRLPFPRPATMAEKAKLLEINKNRGPANWVCVWPRACNR